ncbi:tigger transposable element-derived protein 3 isoform X3 [Ixodes scapularis]|uniref:tigger transposable element-derived protein 3 isoform X3 n=1 Tax=Ixodes scapularis TaxID=6945 RepID=UPI001A9F33C1|nr:tigger transposable element-derived protein 3 isoform X3 [Ixodes scapularis]XP_040356554.1 tigger transposable element-derived protein 3 isoform X3 [Ixodes scapularis]
MDSNLVLGLHQGMGCSSMDGSDVRGLHPSSATSHMGMSCSSMSPGDVRGMHQTNQHANPTTALGIGCSPMGSSDIRTLHPAIDSDRGECMGGSNLVGTDIRSMRSSMDCDRGLGGNSLSTSGGMHSSMEHNKAPVLSSTGSAGGGSSGSNLGNPSPSGEKLGNTGTAATTATNSPDNASNNASKGTEEEEQSSNTTQPPANKKAKEVTTVPLVPPRESKRPNMKKRMDLSLADKVKIVYSLKEPGAKHGAVAKLYGVARSTVCKISQKSEEILLQFETDSNHDRKRRREGKERQVGEELYAWFQNQVAQGSRLSGNDIKEKARLLAAQKGHHFEPSDGWLSRWKQRHGLSNPRKESSSHNQSSHASGAVAQAPPHWVSSAELVALLKQYSADNVFAAAETALYYSAYPADRCQQELVKDKKATERITLLICANLTGTEKRPLLLVGDSGASRSFPDDPSRLPLICKFAQKARMNAAIFTEWLSFWDWQLGLHQRSVLLLVENTPAHTSSAHLENVRLYFHPQPILKGVARNLKAHYRSRLYGRISASLSVQRNTRAADLIRKTTVLDALYLVRESWDSVKGDTVSGVFAQVGLPLCGTPLPRGGAGVTGMQDVSVPSGLTYDEFCRFVNLDDFLEGVVDRTTETHEDEYEVTDQEALKAIDFLRTMAMREGRDEWYRSSREMEDFWLQRMAAKKK